MVEKTVTPMSLRTFISDPLWNVAVVLGIIGGLCTLMLLLMVIALFLINGKTFSYRCEPVINVTCSAPVYIDFDWVTSVVVYNAKMDTKVPQIGSAAGLHITGSYQLSGDTVVISFDQIYQECTGVFSELFISVTEMPLNIRPNVAVATGSTSDQKVYSGPYAFTAFEVTPLNGWYIQAECSNNITQANSANMIYKRG